MLKVGLTGGIAAGKSVVGEMFVALGAHLVQADRIAHSLMQPGEAVYNEVVRHFGREILNRDGSVNREKLAEAAFGKLRTRLAAKGRRRRVTNRRTQPHCASRGHPQPGCVDGGDGAAGSACGRHCGGGADSGSRAPANVSTG